MPTYGPPQPTDCHGRCLESWEDYLRIYGRVAAIDPPASWICHDSHSHFCPRCGRGWTDSEQACRGHKYGLCQRCEGQRQARGG
jgi:hypothetical protein